jgi:hypothetical protein
MRRTLAFGLLRFRDADLERFLALFVSARGHAGFPGAVL